MATAPEEPRATAYERLGGMDANPGKCMVSMHSAFPIAADTAAQWAEAMQRAIADAELPDAEVAELLSERLNMIARAMGRIGEKAEA